ncbi:unnamed protein product [Lactuca saligna]|uniref:Uncharacterized protein n=1 Tax=Lactuca saligna TaxID=75948 RepID=A0AA35VVH7_LACSI|nr:unnamed protein product [Lactuca saligna]
MVAAVDRVFRSGINEAQLKTSQDAIAGLREELRDSEAELRVLSEKNCIVAYEKAALEDHVATLEGQTEQLESQMSSLTQEKGVLASELAMCQRQRMMLLLEAIFNGCWKRAWFE